jgi:hypothetical protein
MISRNGNGEWRGMIFRSIGAQSGLEGRASARPGREESRPSTEVIDLADNRMSHDALWNSTHAIS